MEMAMTGGLLVSRFRQEQIHCVPRIVLAPQSVNRDSSNKTRSFRGLLKLLLCEGVSYAVVASVIRNNDGDSARIAKACKDMLCQSSNALTWADLEVRQPKVQQHAYS